VPVSSPPTFNPAVAPIALGAAGTVLTSNGLTAATPPTFQPAGAGSASATALGARLAFASPAGGAVAAAPAGFTASTATVTGTGRLIVTLAGGNATWISLTPGGDGQLLVIVNEDAANTLTLAASAWGGVADLALPPKARVLAYYDGTAGTPNWKVT
jgi:hypothetical protein